MTKPTHYALEKLSSAVRTLATHPGPIKDRLVSAYTFNVSHLQHRDLPDDYCHRLDRIEEILTRAKEFFDEGEVPERGLVQETADRMTDEEAIEVAQMIVDLEDDVETAWYEGRIEEKD